jgi:hypothetical protein
VTGPLALAVTAELQRHVIDLACLAGATAATALLPRVTPYLVVLAVLFQSSLTHVMTSDGLVLAGVAAGLAIDRARRGAWPALADVPPALAVLLALNVLMAASLVANQGEPALGAAAQATVYFASRSVLLGAVVVLAARSSVGLRDWLAAGALGSLAAGAVRLLEIAGAPLQPAAAALSVHLLGDVRDIGSWNEFATLMVAGALMALTVAIGWPASRRLTALWTAVAVVVLVAGATGQSRTVTVIVLVLFPPLAIAAAAATNRLAIACAGAAFLVVAITPAGSILDKPLVVPAAQVSDTAGGPPPAPVSPLPTPAGPIPAGSGQTAPAFQAQRPPEVDWRAVLDRPYYRIDQVLSHPTVYAHGNYVAILVRSSAASAGVRLQVAVDGRTIGDVGADHMRPTYDWVIVPIPDGVLAGGHDATIGLSVTGSLDSRSRYVSIGGTDGFAAGVSSRAYSGGRLVVNDLSADPGLQRGTYLAFLDDEVPSLTRFRPGPQAVLDPSLSDRLSLWDSALRAFDAHPLLGTGFYTFGSVHDRYASSALFFAYDNAHSNYLELLSDLGALGPLLLLLLMAIAGVPLLVRAGRGGWTDRWPDLALAAIVAAAFLASATQTWIGDSRVAMFFSLFLLVASSEARPAFILTGVAHARSRLGARATAAAAPPE